VGVAERPDDGVDFYERLRELNEELEGLNAEAHLLEERIAGNMKELLDGAPRARQVSEQTCGRRGPGQ